MGKGSESRRSLFCAPEAHEFTRVALCTPKVFLADPSANCEEIAKLAEQAARDHAKVIVFPELSLSGYSDDDLFFQDALLESVRGNLSALCAGTAHLRALLILGAPLRTKEGLFNCAVVLCRGQVVAVIPKSFLPNYREFYEKRYFVPSRQSRHKIISLNGRAVPFGNNLLLNIAGPAGFCLHVEICEDFWVPIPPSTMAALGGAELLVNLSASNAAIGKSDYRKLLAASQSGRCIAAYLYCAAGYGESTTDLAWDGQAMVYENGDLLAENSRFSPASSLLLADIDLGRLRQDRMRTTSFADCADSADLSGLIGVDVDLDLSPSCYPLARTISRFPYIPADPETLAERCSEVCAIQIQGLAKRLDATGIRKAVIGVSGGVDSAQALIVIAKAFDLLKYPREQILCFDMPGFTTSPATRAHAARLMQSLHVTIGEIDIRPSALQMLKDIGHPYAEGRPVYDVTFENVQAGERTSHLFRLANLHNGLVVGTSDLSELALGYTTYGVGDHMSHYAINASVPKTLIRHLLRWTVQEGSLGPDAGTALINILATPSSPELRPPLSGETLQDAEALVGPYALQDFFLYYFSRFGYRPSKIAFLALEAWQNPDRGFWPATISGRTAYDLPIIKHWLEVFIRRFFGSSQFKRSALPNGPKVGSGGCLSPRGDWRAPSDCGPEAWLEELARNVP